MKTDPKQAAERADVLFHEGYNCCESTLTALSEAMGVGDCGCLPAIATGMGGGVGHTGDICGAVTGAAMAIGLASSVMKLDNHTAEKQWANELVAELVDAFRREQNFLKCGELIPINWRAAGAPETYKAGGCKAKCTGFVRFATEWTARRLEVEGL